MSDIRFRVTLRGEDLGIFDPDDITMDHAMMLEDVTHLTITEVVTGLPKLSARSLRALVWLQRVRNGDLAATPHEDFTIGELKTEKIPDPTEAADSTSAADDGTVSAPNGTGTSDS